MGREWKPGDVAMLLICDERVPAVVQSKKDADYLVWQIGGHSYYRSIAVDNDVLIQEVRPLVVIDPEDREQVERLLNLYWVERNPDDEADIQNYPEYVNDLQAALREIADPKPEEPTGLGAVVEDEDGDRWIRTCEPCDDCLNKPWQRGPVRRNWLIVPAVRVLSEGVRA